MFSTRWAKKKLLFVELLAKPATNRCHRGCKGMQRGKNFPKWRNEASQIVSYRSCCHQQLFKAHQLYIHHWNSVSHGPWKLTWLNKSCQLHIPSLCVCVFFASAHQTSCSNCNLGVSKHCASSRKRGATPLSSTLAMGGFCSMPRSNNAGLGKPPINCMGCNL